jgi:hypothetical protein
MAADRQLAYKLIDQLDGSQLDKVVRLLETIVDPVSRAIANAPLDDEPLTEEDRRAVAESREWFKMIPEGISFETILADCGLTLDELKNAPADPHPNQ